MSKKPRAPRKAKAPKDVNAPKRPQSAYFLFANERRAHMKETYPDKGVTELAKLIAAEWKTMGDEDKKPYTEKATVAKGEYDIKLATYKQTDMYTEFQKRLKLWKEEQKRTAAEAVDSDAPKVRLPKKPKDPNAPKKPQSAYFLYAQERRAPLREANPDKKMTDVAKLIGEEWKNVTEDQKKQYNEKYEKDKKEFEVKNAAYKGSENAKAFETTIKEWNEKCDAARARAAANRAKKNKSAAKKKKPESSDDESSDSDSDSSSSSGSSGSSSSGSSGSGSSDSDSD